MADPPNLSFRDDVMNDRRRKKSLANERVVKGVRSNPLFELLRNWSDTAGPFAGPVQRGALITKYPDGNGIQWMLNFMLNPSVISHSFSVDLGGIYSAANSSDADHAGLAYGKSRTMQLSLLFDRKLEVAADSNHRGVEVDVEVFLRLLGIEDIHNDLPTSVHVVKAYILRGGGPHVPGKTGSSREESIVNLEGWITSADVTYPSFAWDMTPTRAVINVSMEQVLRGEEDTENVPSTDSDGMRSEISQSRDIIGDLS